MKIRYLLLGIIILASVLRFINLGQVPYGLSNDESSYIYSAYSVWKTGKGLDGTFLPISFNTDSSNSPVPVYLSAPFVGLLGVSEQTGRLPYILLGIGSIFVLYFLVKELLDNEKIALLSAAVLSVSPWHLHVTRTAYDTVFAMFFLLLGTYLFVRGVKKGSILWSLISFFLAFYSYHATKFVFFFLLPVLIVIFYAPLKKRKREAILFIGGYIAILISFAIIMTGAGITRQDETLLSYKDKKAVSTVNYELVKNEAPVAIRKLFNNKPLYFFRVIRENYFEVFSTNFLFLYGDTTSSAVRLGVLSRGVMYLIELPLLILGLYYLFRRGPTLGRNVIMAGLLTAPLASTFVSGKSYVFRNLTMTPFLAIIVGCGIYAGYLLIREYPSVLRKALSIGFLVVYSIFTLSYLYQYHYRYSVYGAEAWTRGNREVTEYLLQKRNEYKHIYFYAPDAPNSPGNIMLAQYGIFGRIEPTDIQRAWVTKTPVIGNVTFLDHCPDLLKLPKMSKKNKTLYIYPVDKCSQNIAPIYTFHDYGESTIVLWQVYEI